MGQGKLATSAAETSSFPKCCGLGFHCLGEKALSRRAGKAVQRHSFAREELRAAREMGMEGEQKQTPQEGTELFLNRGKHVGRAEAGQVGSPPGWGPRREALMRGGSALCPGG